MLRSARLVTGPSGYIISHESWSNVSILSLIRWPLRNHPNDYIGPPGEEGIFQRRYAAYHVPTVIIDAVLPPIPFEIDRVFIA
jgi:hypothetical protein